MQIQWNQLWREWGVPLLAAVLIATTVKSAIADWYVVPTGSMKPTIIEGDRIFVNKLAYDLKIPYTRFHVKEWENPKRGDIVVFISPKNGTRLVKRVVGLPGDTLTMEDSRLLINGQPLVYQKGSAAAQAMAAAESDFPQIFETEHLADITHPVMLTPRIRSIRDFGPLKIPANHFFMLGDNRDNSADSRFFGYVDRDLILGKAVGIAISLDIFNYWKPRWERFFSAFAS